MTLTVFIAAVTSAIVPDHISMIPALSLPCPASPDASSFSRSHTLDPPFSIELKPLAYAWMAAHPKHQCANGGPTEDWNNTHRERAFIAWAQERHRAWPTTQTIVYTPKALRRLRRQFARSALKQALTRLSANCLNGDRIDDRLTCWDVADWFEAVVQLPGPYGRAFFAEAEYELLRQSALDQHERIRCGLKWVCPHRDSSD